MKGGLYPLNKKAVDSRILVSPSSPQPITSVTRCQTVFKKSILEVLSATPSADTAMAMVWRIRLENEPGCKLHMVKF